MMERRLSLPSLAGLDPAVTMKNSSLLKAAKGGRAGGPEPTHSSREKSSLWQQKKAISFDLDSNNDHNSKHVQAGFPRTWFDIQHMTD